MSSARPAWRRYRGWCCLIVPLVLAATVTRADDRLPGRPDTVWEAVFQRRDGWTGGDGMCSVELGDGRTLWLYSDTWIGRVVDGKHAPGSRLVNNTIGVHPTPVGGDMVASDAVEFHWGANDGSGHPMAWIVPDPVRVPAHGATPAGDGPSDWYWLADGIVTDDAEGRPRLVLFLMHIGRGGGEGVWNFKSVGGAVAVIDNPHQPVSQWHVRQFDNPHAIDRDTAAADPNVLEVSWGAEVIRAPDPPIDGRAQVYVYGVRETDGWDKHLVLAEAPAAKIEAFDAWRFRTADGWSDDVADAAPIAHDLVNELSVHHVTIGGQPRWLMVHSEPLFGTRILVRIADRPEGPWSSPVPVYDVPGVKAHESYFTYAAKGHPHLSRPGELLITYTINANDFWAMVGDANIYRPMFVRLPLAALVDAK